MRSVLITGGTGFFGRAFAHRLLDDDLCERICIYSRDEFKQAQMRREFDDDPRFRFFIGDVRDRERLTRAFELVDVVVHAAALKRIEVGRYNPDEMVKTNIGGTINVIEAARAAYVKRAVFLSSDKAYEPVSPYGQSKALAESLFLAANHTQGLDCQMRPRPRFAVTRYGNVAGSTGSVIPTWRQQLSDRGEITLTDPDCTRFWMEVDQAVDLVLETIEGMPDEPAIPELPAFRLGDLADAMEAEKVRFTGLPTHEKRHESMCLGRSSDEARRMTVSELRRGLARV